MRDARGRAGMVSALTITVLSIVVGGILGYWIDIDAAIHRFGDWIQRKLDAAFKGSTALGNFSRWICCYHAHSSALFTAILPAAKRLAA